MEDIVVGIDIGTTKVCALIGRIDKANQLNVLGVGTEACNGVRKGVIVDMDSTANSIKAAVEQAESMAGLRVGSAYANIPGIHVSVINNRTGINVSNENREITIKDVERLLYSARNVSVPEDRQIIDIIPKQYIIDGYDEIIDPVGMVGVKMEVDADVVAGKITSVQNIVRSMERAGIKTDGLVVEALATGEVVLTPEEKEMSVLLIDVGGGITDVSVFKSKKLVLCDSIPVGGDHITNDISIGLKIPYSEAEKVKREFGLALTSLIKNDQEFSVFDVNENRKKSIKVSEVVEIIEARVHEIFTLINDLLASNGIDSSNIAGVVLAGGGITNADGCIQLANEVFGIPVRVVSNRSLGIGKSEHITAAGIVKYIAVNAKGNNMSSDVKNIKQKAVKKEWGLFKRISKLFNNLF
ncbi:MAG: cell division protein FtsA [Clostridia bacterium]|nr:cell division protein FtsA [Clostridia bacterium]